MNRMMLMSIGLVRINVGFILLLWLWLLLWLLLLLLLWLLLLWLLLLWLLLLWLFLFGVYPQQVYYIIHRNKNGVITTRRLQTTIQYVE